MRHLGSTRVGVYLSAIALMGAAGLGLVSLPSPVAAEGKAGAKAAESKEPVSLFNGKDLTGWKVYGTEIWEVNKDGELVCESGPDKEYGYLGTTKDYKNFDLTLEFKQEANGNSGLFFRSKIPEGVKIAGWQAEIAPPGSNSGRIYESYGRGWITPEVTAEQNAALKFGEWNTMRLRVEGGHVQTWVNGVAVADLTDEKIAQTEGFIALQIHSGGGIKVRWRNIKLTEL